MLSHSLTLNDSPSTIVFASVTCLYDSRLRTICDAAETWNTGRVSANRLRYVKLCHIRCRLELGEYLIILFVNAGSENKYFHIVGITCNK